MGDEAKGVLAQIPAMARFVLAGVVTLLALWWANPVLPIEKLFAEWWRGVGLGAVLGCVAYGFYASVLESRFVLLLLLKLLRRRGGETYRRFFQKRQARSDREIIQELWRERWSRYASTDECVKSSQEGLLHSYDWVIFLYCTGLLLLASDAAAWFYWRVGWHGHLKLIAGGLAALMAALAWDEELVGREIWLTEHSPQWEEKEKKAKA